jgi:hypothetical protein
VSGCNGGHTAIGSSVSLITAVNTSCGEDDINGPDQP